MAGLFAALSIAASGLTAERLRMDVISNNLANANTTRTPQGGPFQRQEVILGERGRPQSSPLRSVSASASGVDSMPSGGGVDVLAIVPDSTPARRVYDPGHPDADTEGYVTLPNVNSVTEMVDLITATRAYEANTSVIQAVKHEAQRAIDILR